MSAAEEDFAREALRSEQKMTRVVGHFLSSYFSKAHQSLEACFQTCSPHQRLSDVKDNTCDVVECPAD